MQTSKFKNQNSRADSQNESGKVRLKLSDTGQSQEKRQRTAALQNLRYFETFTRSAQASWTAAVLCRFCTSASNQDS
ncbi:MAG: hypothetical protein C5B50_22590 [Verrucomicrobia bacterium]|nr:MAG: hypothetical protein C5B50_22590 [Verrucomicrobiota bacterium]